MMFGVLGRALFVPVLLFVLNSTTAYAHSLPGSVLTFSERGERLNLSMSFALEDLIIAAPAFKTLETAPRDQSLSAEALDFLASYLEAHLQLESESKRLPLTLVSASLERASTGNLLPVVLVTSRLSFPMPESGRVFPLALTYDALMHEIRSHRASVYWTTENGRQLGLANFGFKRTDGKPPAHLLQAP